MEENNIKTYDKCGDVMRGHEDESGTHCRWCVTGWESCDEFGDDEACGS